MIFSNDYLTNTDKERIHKAVCHVFEKVGMVFKCEKAIEVFKKHGAKTDGDVVRFNEDFLMSAVKNAPRTFKVCGRTEDKDFVVGTGEAAFTPASGPVFVKVGGEKRLCRKDDYVDFLKLTETSDVVNFANYIVVEPQDMPEEKRKLYQVAQTLAMTTKPVVGTAMGEGMTDRALELFSDFYGDLSCCRTITVVSPRSPLLYDNSMTELIFSYAKYGQGLMFASCSLPGATSPVTVAGTVVIDTVQSLAGIVLAQLLNPGMPVLFSSTSCSTDMRYLTPSIGAPETGMISAATASMSHYYNLPCRTGGTLNDAKELDAQAGLEAAMTLLPALSSGADFILQAAGILDSFNVVSLEKFVFDEDVIRFAKKLVSGFEVNDDTMALDLIAEVGAYGQYLESDNTIENYRDLFVPKILSREDYNAWKNNGSRPLTEVAAAEAKRRIDSYERPYLEPEREKLLSKFIED